MTAKPHHKITNNDTGALITIDLPGVTKENIKLSSENNTLKIDAPRDQNTPDGWQLINQATKPERYELDLKLDNTLNLSAADAKFENAVLTLKISKHESSLPRAISIAD